jgi:polyhydroxyalkanoate synthesis regulator phasin
MASATDESPGAPTIEYQVDGGAWTAYDGAFWINEDGAHQVAVRATDVAGNVSAPAQEEILLDRVAPSVSVSGLQDGAELGLAALRSVTVSATDATSGLASTSITLDGASVATPVSVDAVALLTGEHTLRVSATDLAGHTTVETITFAVVASYDGAFDLVERLVDEGRLSRQKAKKLRNLLLTAQQADVRGQEGAARNALTKFIDVAETVSQAAARTALVDAGKELRADL